MPFLAAFLLVFLLAPCANAQSTDETRAALSGTLSEIKASNEAQKKLEQKRAALERELKTLQKEMVAQAQTENAIEQQLTDLEEKLRILEDQKTEKNKALEARRAELSATLSAMIKLKQLPPEAVIAMPGKLDETLATARALGLISHAVEEVAESLKAQIKELNELEDKIHENRKVIAAKKEVLEARHRQLAAKIRERSRLQAALNGKEREEKERSAKLMAKSHSLQDLLDSLEKSEHAGNAWERSLALSTRQERHSPKHHLRPFEDAKGDISLPAAGRIISRYGNARSGTAFSKGIMIETRPEANVVAPFDGEVVYAGPFRDYGRMVIIRHSNDYHTLLSGMERIDCAPGQFLLEGEPIGAMGRRASGTRLYTELRKDGKPIDPMPWFKG
jgi:septal ring factor EnvC (AmiA/AmiB activator)